MRYGQLLASIEELAAERRVGYARSTKRYLRGLSLVCAIAPSAASFSEAFAIALEERSKTLLMADGVKS